MTSRHDAAPAGLDVRRRFALVPIFVILPAVLGAAGIPAVAAV